jgi:DDE superfamily endonuclease
VVLDLYQRVFQAAELGEDEYVISADEKTSIQARCRCHPTLPPGQARSMRVEHEYERRGALAYLAAWDVHHARLFGRLEPTTGIEPFGRLVEQVMTIEPYASAERVFWIVDNGSSHRGQAAMQRLEGNYVNLRLVGNYVNLRLVHLPVHASWLNQIEIYFSIVQRKVLIPNDLTDLAESSSACLASSAATSRRRSRSPGAIRGLTWTGSSAAWTNQPSPSKPHDHRASGSISSRRPSRRSDLEEAVERRRRVLVAARDGERGGRLARIVAQRAVSRAPRTVMTTTPAANTRAAQSAAPRSCGGWAGQAHGVVQAAWRACRVTTR